MLVESRIGVLVESRIGVLVLGWVTVVVLCCVPSSILIRWRVGHCCSCSVFCLQHSLVGPLSEWLLLYITIGLVTLVVTVL